VLTRNENDEKAWTEYILSSPNSSFSHQIIWKKILKTSYGLKSYYLMAIERNEVKGVLPLFLGKSLFFGSFLATGLYCSHGGICADGPEAGELLIEKAIQLTREMGVGYLEIKNYNTKYGKLITKDQYCTMILPLDPDPQKIWEPCVHASRRKYVRRAKKRGMKAEIGGLEHFDDYYRVLSRSMRDLGTPVHGRRFFKTVFSEFNDQSKIIIVKNGKEAVAAGNLILFRDTAYAMWAGSNREFQKIYPNELMYWKAIEYSCENGYRYLDFGRSKWNSGTFQFKSRLGAEPVPLFYEYHLNRKKELPDIDPMNPRYRMYINIWRKLPLFLVNAVGSRIIRFVP
jgi:FemAB-related protein (PEP-CTERM system-associated)